MTTTKSVYQRGLDAPVAGPNRRGAKRIAVIGAGACGVPALLVGVQLLRQSASAKSQSSRI